MKALIVLLATGTVMLAQTPAPPKSAAPQAPAESPLLHPANLKAVAPSSFKVKFVTTHGDFTVEVHRDWSPLGADRFYNLARNKFFTDTAFFRYVPGFIVHFGFHARPEIAKAWENASFNDVPIKPGNSNRKGTVVFARSEE